MLQRLLDIPGDPDLRRRGRTVVVISLLLFFLNLARPPLALLGGIALVSTLPATLIGIVGTITPIWLARCGKVDLAAWILVVLGLIVISATPLLQGELLITAIFLAIPVLLAGLMLRPWHVWVAVGLAFATLGGLVVATTGTSWRGGELPFVLALNALIFAVGVIGFVAARVNTAVLAEAAAARNAAESASLRLEELNTTLEQRVDAQTAELRRALDEVKARAAAQETLLQENENQRVAIRELSVPVLPVRHDTLIVPLVGALDSTRLHELQTRALHAVEQRRARVLLLDITGVPVVDTQVAQGLIQVIQSTRLIGAEPVLVGVRPEVAQTIVALGVDLVGVRTAASLASALAEQTLLAQNRL